MMTPEEIVTALKSEIQTGDINRHFMTELGVDENMAAILTSAALARAITYGYAITTTIDSFIEAWRKADG